MMGQDPNSPRNITDPVPQKQEQQAGQEEHFAGAAPQAGQYQPPPFVQHAYRDTTPDTYQQQFYAQQQHSISQQIQEYQQYYAPHTEQHASFDRPDPVSARTGHFPTRLSSSIPESYLNVESSSRASSHFLREGTSQYERVPGASQSSLSTSSSYPLIEQHAKYESSWPAAAAQRPQQQQQQQQQSQPLPSGHTMSTASWQPRTASAPTSASSSSVPMFRERLHQRTSMQLSNIPHIPNIVVDAVPARDYFGHSRTPPFVQSDWPSQWGLHVPSSSKKMRTNSDSAIYEAEREQQHRQKTGYIPSSWEMLAFQKSQGGEGQHEQHIMTTAAEETSLQGQLPQQHTTYQSSQRSQQQALPAATAAAEAEHHLITQETQASHPQAMEVDIEEQQALNLKLVPTQQSCPLPGPMESSKPSVPFIWKFQAQKSSESPKTSWLRRHSDSTVPNEPEDLTVPKSSARSRSTGATISEEKRLEHSLDTGESGGATGSSTSGAEGGDIPSPKEHGGDLLSKRLKLKKYLQKRYQLSLESTSRHHSTESDDVFSPSPGIFGSSQGFVFSPTLLEDEISPRPHRPSPLASSSHSSPIKTPQRKDTFSKPLAIKTEPISPISSESEGEADDAGLFLSPAFISPHSASPSSQGSVFQFHSPVSYSRSSESEKSDYSQRPESDLSARIPIRRSASPDIHSPGPHVYLESIEMEPAPSPSLASHSSSADPPNMEILRQGRLPPLASMLSHPSFTNPNIPTFSAPQTPPFGSYQTQRATKTSAEQGSSSVGAPATSSQWPTSPAQPPPPPRTRSVSETDKPLEPSKIIYCPFSEKVQEQRYQREMTFLCPVCGQMFPSYNYLANHMVNHLPSEVVSKGPGDGNKVHLCKVCNRSFSRSDMLTRHMRLHTGLRPYECRMCGQVFSRSDHLHTHLRTHTGEKPYRCPQCPYAAPRRDMITRHMRIHTKHFSRRGRRTSSTGSADTLHSSSFSSLESGDSDVKKRNQSLSSMGSEGSTEVFPYRRSSGASLDTAELDISKSCHWSHTSGESLESGADSGVPIPARKYSHKWSLTSIESIDIPVAPSSHPAATAGSSTVTSPHMAVAEHRTAQRTLSATSMESGETEESRSTPISMDTGGGQRALGIVEQAEMQSSFQKFRVGSDKDSSESEHASPAHGNPPLSGDSQ